MRTQGIGWQQLAQPNPHSAGLPEITITDENELMSKLRIEYLREFWGEGQIFLYVQTAVRQHPEYRKWAQHLYLWGQCRPLRPPPPCRPKKSKTVKTAYYENEKILYLFLLPLIFTACETKDIPVYTSDDAALYFQRTASYIWGKHHCHLFQQHRIHFCRSSCRKKNSVTYSAEVRTMGNVTDYDRPFKVEIDKEMSTGIQGVHFDTNLDTLKIKAGKSNAYVRITFLPYARFTRQYPLTVVLHLIENEHFNARIDEYKKNEPMELQQRKT